MDHIVAAFDLGIEAVLLTHIGGYPIPEIKEISNFCKDKGIYLLKTVHFTFYKNR